MVHRARLTSDALPLTIATDNLDELIRFNQKTGTKSVQNADAIDERLNARILRFVLRKYWEMV
jgi:hypothetical protein